MQQSKVAPTCISPECIPAGTASKEATLQACLKQFFSQEEITWECPAEKQSKKKTRRKSLAEAASGTPQSPATPSQAAMNGLTRLSVSFSGEDIPVLDNAGKSYPHLLLYKAPCMLTLAFIIH